MKFFFFLKTLPLTVLLGFLLFPSVVSAQLIPCGGAGQDPCNLCHLFELFDNIARFVLFVIVPPVAILMLIIGGLLFYFSVGDPSKTKQAINLIKATVVGMLIVYFAWSIVVAVFLMIGIADWEQWSYRLVC